MMLQNIMLTGYCIFNGLPKQAKKKVIVLT